VVRVEGQQPVLVGGELEEVALLFGPGHLGAGFGGVAEAVRLHLGLVLDEIALVADRVPAGVLGEVDVPVGFHPLPERLGRLVVVRVRGADEAAQGDAEVIAHLAECCRVAVGEFLDRDAFLFRRLLHLQAVLVRAGHEEDVVAVQALEARHRIGGDHLVGVADVRHAVGVADGRGDVERGFFGSGHSFNLDQFGEGIALADKFVVM
jgi:hypothetical protein